MNTSTSETRKALIHDLDILLDELARKINSGAGSSIASCVADLTDAQIDELVDKAAWIIEWLGWS